MDNHLVGQFKFVVRKIANNLTIEVVNYPVTTSFTLQIDQSLIDLHVEDIVNRLMPSIQAGVRELYERALNT
jgi:hypothetical protein